jgi:hypothetical protein
MYVVQALRYMPINFYTIKIRYSIKNLYYKDGLLNIRHFMADYTTDLIQMVEKINLNKIE